MFAVNQNTIQVLFALVRNAVRGDKLTEQERDLCKNKIFPDLMTVSRKHDIAHLVAAGLDNNLLLAGGNEEIGQEILKAIFRYTQQNYEYCELCEALESAEIPFIPLKGSVLREYYPEPWMRTSCDIDILVHHKDLAAAISYLVEKQRYVEKGRATHDVALFTKRGNRIELHFDLVEEGRANQANDVLKEVWNNASIKSGHKYWYEMSDEYFYFYHIAHMAKHFESGGCGIRPFIDLWILDNIEGANKQSRDELLRKGGLLKFTEIARRLSRCWFNGEKYDEISVRVQNFILGGGVYGTSQNKVALQQERKGGRIGYLFSRMFVPYSKLKRYYPVLDKHRWLTPVMQIRRWFMLLRPDVAKMAKNELSVNKKIDKSKAEEMNLFLLEIGL